MENVLYSRVVARHLTDDEGDPACAVHVTREVNFILVTFTDAMTIGTEVLACFNKHEQNTAIEWVFTQEGKNAIANAINESRRQS